MPEIKQQRWKSVEYTKRQINDFDENFETTYTEEYNLENFELSEWQIESFARILLPSIREYYKDPKHVQEANEWTKQQTSNR